MGGGVERWRGGWVDGWVDDGWVDGWVDGRVAGWLDGWLDGWMAMPVRLALLPHVCVSITPPPPSPPPPLASGPHAHTHHVVQVLWMRGRRRPCPCRRLYPHSWHRDPSRDPVLSVLPDRCRRGCVQRCTRLAGPSGARTVGQGLGGDGWVHRALGRAWHGSQHCAAVARSPCRPPCARRGHDCGPWLAVVIGVSPPGPPLTNPPRAT
jgi:hypothetical protein